MTSQVNECAWRAVAGGTADFVVASAITGYYTPAQCTTPAIVDAGLYHYRAESDDLSQYESGQGTYDAATSTLIRTTVYQSSNAGLPQNFSAAPKVRLSAAAQDIVTPYLNTFENITSGAVPVNANVAVYATYVTSGATGAEQVVLPATLTPADAGRLHLVYLVTMGAPTDVIVLPGDFETRLTFVNAFAIYQWDGYGWQFLTGQCRFNLLSGTNIAVRVLTESGYWLDYTLPSLFAAILPTLTVAPNKVLSSTSTGGAPDWRDKPPSDITTADSLNLSLAPTASAGLTTYYTNVASSNVADNRVILLGTSSLPSGHVKGFNFFRANPADTATFDLTYIRKSDGTTPTSITFDTNDQEAFFEWRYSTQLWYVIDRLTTATVV